MKRDPHAVQFTSLIASNCAPCDLAAEQGVGQFAPLPPADEDHQVERESVPAGTGWAGVIGMEDTVTGDGRMIERNALRWDDQPLPLRYVAEDVGAHDGAVTVGRILGVERRAGGVIYAWGDFDMDSDAGREAYRQVSEGLTTGVSMDLDDVSFEVRIAAEVLTDMDAMDGPMELPAPDADGKVTVATINADDELRVTTGGRVRAATIVSIPAFAEAHIAPSDMAEAVAEDAPALVASGAPVAPPLDWFTNPGLDGPTPLTVTADGRVYGHVALWGTCHTGHAQRGQCVTPPTSRTGYAHFLTGALVTAEGDTVPVGHITLDTRHAHESLNASSAAVHYDDTGSVVADVMAGEDAHGIWFSGAVRPGVGDEKVRALRAAPLSGDWRAVGGNLELVAMLGVNMPGFPVPRASGLVASGNVVSLVASGMVPPIATADGGDSLDMDDMVYLRRLAAQMRGAEQAERDRTAKRLSDRRHAVENAQKVVAFARRRKG